MSKTIKIKNGNIKEAFKEIATKSVLNRYPQFPDEAILSERGKKVENILKSRLRKLST